MNEGVIEVLNGITKDNINDKINEINKIQQNIKKILLITTKEPNIIFILIKDKWYNYTIDDNVSNSDIIKLMKEIKF